MRYLSLFSGVEAATLAWKPLGWEAVAFAEVNPFASAVLAHRFPETPNLGDVTKIGEAELEKLGRFDVMIFGSPCFTSETSVLTDRGLTGISEIKVGDMVLTHKNRYRKVLSVGSTISKTIVLKGYGHWGLETTAEHPFYSVSSSKTWVIGSKKNKVQCWKRSFSTPEWTPASKMAGRYWAFPTTFPELPIPKFERLGKEKILPELSESFFWFVGAWLGDGWTNISKRRGQAILCAGKHQADFVADKLKEIGLHFWTSEERTTRRFVISSKSLSRWLRENFGIGSDGKSMPSWCFGMDRKFRVALLEGYRFADGSKDPKGFRIATISRELAISTKLLVSSLGFFASVHVFQAKRENIGSTFIEGRKVNENPLYQVVVRASARSAIHIENHVFGLVRSASEGSESKIVYNLEVEEDNSYTADGVVVHNCQNFSVAGKREGMEDADGERTRSGLFFEAIRIVRLAARVNGCKWFIMENVPGMLSCRGGRDFAAILREISGCTFPVPGDGWRNGGVVRGEDGGWSLAWRTLDARFFGVPQNRRRVFIVGHLGSWSCPAAVLFVGQGLSRNPPSRGKSGKDYSRSLKGGSRGYGGQDASCGQLTLIVEGVDTEPFGTVARGVRFFTPIEQERLQGFPDDWTKIPYRGKPAELCPDRGRNQTIGNSFAVPVIRWLGERLERMENP